MPKALVLTLIGDDRTGLVESVAETVQLYDGNWVESRLARLAGKFAGVVRVDVPEAQAAALQSALKGLTDKGLSVVVDAGASGDAVTDRLMRLELVGVDRPGMVRELTHALVQKGVNVLELHTTCVSAPMSGEMMFTAEAQLAVPRDAEVEVLRETLEAVADELSADVTLEDAGGRV